VPYVGPLAQLGHTVRFASRLSVIADERIRGRRVSIGAGAPGVAAAADGDELVKSFPRNRGRRDGSGGPRRYVALSGEVADQIVLVRDGVPAGPHRSSSRWWKRKRRPGLISAATAPRHRHDQRSRKQKVLPPPCALTEVQRAASPPRAP
jgi:hypothetical protein